MDKKNAVWSKRITDKLSNDLKQVSAMDYEEMEQKIEDIMMRYAYMATHDYKAAYTKEAI